VLLNGVDELFIVDDIIGAPPHKPSSTGKVYVRKGRNSKAVRSYYPIVFGCQWVQVDGVVDVVDDDDDVKDYLREFKLDNVVVVAHPLTDVCMDTFNDVVVGFRVETRRDNEVVSEAEVGEAETADMVFDGYVSAELFRKGYARRV
jgi:hypothetical protein